MSTLTMRRQKMAATSREVDNLHRVNYDTKWNVSATKDIVYDSTQKTYFLIGKVKYERA